MAKLIRDEIPEIMRKNGKQPKVHVANDTEFEQKLRAKLVEEAAEFMKDGNVEELADILEVLQAVCAHKKLSWEKLEELRKKKATERGGFSKRLILEDIH